MLQARIVSPEQLTVESVPVPRLQGPGEILVRTAACGICSGDLMPWYLAKKVGSVLGHEVVGWAAEVGEAVYHIRPGDLVFMHHHAPCLKCPDCERGAFVHCRTWRSSRLDPGGMAEWLRVPAGIVEADTFAVNDLTVEQAVFIEPPACSIKALRRVPELRGIGVIVGCGVMGLLNLAAGQLLGSFTAIAVEPDLHRLRLSHEFGAREALTPSEAATGLGQAADFVIIGPGQPEVIRTALGYVRPGGTALLFTPTPAGVTTTLDLGDLYFREISLVPSYSCGPLETRQAYRMLQEGRIRTDLLVTHRFPLKDVQTAFDTARQGGPVLKVLITLATEKGESHEPE